MSNDLSLKDTYRATDVFRWQIVKTHRQQSVAEHSFQVALIASRICDLDEADEETRNKVLWYALVHDLPEVVTGDMATPLKKMLGAAARLRLSQFEESLTIGGKVIDAPPHVKHIVKMADLIEAAAFLHQNAASSHGKDICSKIIAELSADETAAAILREILYSEIVTLDSIMDKEPEQ